MMYYYYLFIVNSYFITLLDSLILLDYFCLNH